MMQNEMVYFTGTKVAELNTMLTLFAYIDNRFSRIFRLSKYCIQGTCTLPDCLLYIVSLKEKYDCTAFKNH